MEKKIKHELAEFTEINETMKAAAHMVGFDVDGETDKVLAAVDNRVRVNLWQRYAIKMLNILLEN
jgi:hypothetical protein